MGSSASRPAVQAEAPASPSLAESPSVVPSQPSSPSSNPLPIRSDSTSIATENSPSTSTDPPQAETGVIPRSKVDPFAELEKRAGAQNAEILRAYADTLPVSQVEAVMNQAQYRGIPMGIGTGVATYLWSRSRYMRMTWNASMTAGCGAAITSSFIFSIMWYYNGLAIMRQVDDTLHLGWQLRYGYRVPVDVEPEGPPEEKNLWTWLGWKPPKPEGQQEEATATEQVKS